MTGLTASDGIAWNPMCSIEKYSPDQVRWARRQLAAERGRLGTVLEARLGRPVPPVLHGSWLSAACGVPECGIVYDRGNGVTSSGVANLAAVLTGTGGHPLAPGRMVFGVGSDPADFDCEHVHLAGTQGEEPGRSWYRPMDAGFPQVPRPGVIEGQATFAEAEACFAWHEWCWGTGPGQPRAHHRLLSAYHGEQPVMMNRKAHKAGYGEKEPGVAWVFRTEVRLS